MEKQKHMYVIRINGNGKCDRKYSNEKYNNGRMGLEMNLDVQVQVQMQTENELE
jgi:hypothetical protein